MLESQRRAERFNGNKPHELGLAGCIGRDFNKRSGLPDLLCSKYSLSVMSDEDYNTAAEHVAWQGGQPIATAAIATAPACSTPTIENTSGTDGTRIASPSCARIGRTDGEASTAS